MSKIQRWNRYDVTLRGTPFMRGGAAATRIADESDDNRDVVPYREKLNEGQECVCGSRFVKGAV